MMTNDAAIADTDATADARLDSTTSATCPPSYVTVGGQTSKYRGLTNSIVWLSAEQTCETDGTHLVIVDNAAELTAMTNLIPGQNLWIGVTDRKTIGAFLAVTGPSAAYLPWDASEPDGSAAECVFIDSLTLKMADQGCGSGRRAVCECDGVPADPTSY